MKTTIVDGLNNKQSIILQCLLAAAVAAIAVVAFSYQAGLSVIAGAVTSMLYQKHMVRIVNRALDLPPAQAVALMRAGMYMRLILIIAMTIVAIKLGFFEIWWMLGSFFLSQSVFLRDLVRVGLRT